MNITNYNAAQLLDLMRPEVERILGNCEAEFPGSIGTCPSQSMRAHNAIRKITEVSDNLKTPMPRRFKLNRLKNRLEAFLAVWDTVNIIERLGRDEHGKLDIFALDKTNI